MKPSAADLDTTPSQIVCDDTCFALWGIELK